MKISQKSLLLAIAALSAGSAQAGGLEKTVSWSGKYVGVGGAASSWVTGSESLYFNPAGLSMKTGEHGDVSLNLSPTLTGFKGPVSATSGEQSSKTGFSPVGGLLASYHLNDQLGLGVGYYVVGGTNAEYDTFNSTNGTAVTLKSKLSISELAIGAGYEVMPGLRLGASWRILHVGGDLNTAGVTGPASRAYFEESDIKKTRLNGFKVGAQYQGTEKKWGLGATYRNNVNFNADASQRATSLTAAPAPATSEGTLSAALPWQATLGGFYQIDNAWRAHLEYVFTDYSKISAINITGATNGVLPVRWKDQSNYKVGVEYFGVPALTLRAGYVYTTPVVPAGTASPTFSSPGSGHTFAIGAGKVLADNIFELNAALEYSMAKGSVAAADQSNGGTALASPNIGDYKSHSWGLHLTGNYNF
jgi:long-subunit fatty acid transport protein